MRYAPDLIMVAGERHVPLMVEVDLGTESIASAAPNSWATKYQQYASYLQKEFGSDPLFAGCAKPLMIVLSNSARRMGNLVSAVEEWGGRRSWWFATLDAINPVSYLPPGEYWREASADRFLSLSDALCSSARSLARSLAPNSDNSSKEQQSTTNS